MLAIGSARFLLEGVAPVCGIFFDPPTDPFLPAVASCAFLEIPIFIPYASHLSGRNKSRYLTVKVRWRIAKSVERRSGNIQYRFRVIQGISADLGTSNAQNAKLEILIELKTPTMHVTLAKAADQAKPGSTGLKLRQTPRSR